MGFSLLYSFLTGFNAFMEVLPSFSRLHQTFSAINWVALGLIALLGISWAWSFDECCWVPPDLGWELVIFFLPNFYGFLPSFSRLARLFFYSILQVCFGIGECDGDESLIMRTALAGVVFFSCYLFGFVCFFLLQDTAKLYMRHHKVPRSMQRRVQRWYDYSWSR